MLTRSASKRLNGTSPSNEKNRTSPSKQVKVKEKKTKKKSPKKEKGKPEPKKTSLVVPTKLNQELNKQDAEGISLNTSEKRVIVNRDEKKNKKLSSPIVNIHIHVSPTNNTTPPPKVQPIIHLHFDENGKKIVGTEVISPSKRMIETRVQNFMAVTSTNSTDMEINYCDSSVVSNVNENNHGSSLENGTSQNKETEIDNSEVMSDLSEINNSAISTEWHVSEFTHKEFPVLKLVNLKKHTQQKHHHYDITNLYKTGHDKDFESVFPKLEAKLENLVKGHIQKVNAISYNNVKRKMNRLKYKQVRKLIERNRVMATVGENGTMKKPNKPTEPDVKTQEPMKDEKVKSKKKEKKKKNEKKVLEEVQQAKDVLNEGKQEADIDIDCGNDDENDERETKTKEKKSKKSERRQKMKSKEKVDDTDDDSSTQATEKETTVTSEKPQELESIPETSFQSVNNNEEAKQEENMLLCETPKRLSTYHQIKKRLSKEIKDPELSPKELPKKKQTDEDDVTPSDNDRNKEVCTSAHTPNREHNPEWTNNNRCITLLAEGCNFSEILQKFRNKHYQEKLFQPNKSKIQNKPNDQEEILDESSCTAKETSSQEDESRKRRSPSSDVSTVENIKRRKGKEKDKELQNDIEVNESSNPSLPIEGPIKCSLSEQFLVSTSTSPQESLEQTNTNEPSNGNDSDDKNLDSDIERGCDQQNSDSIQVENNDNESSENSSTTGDERNPQMKVMLEEDSKINEFRSIKKKLRTVPVNKVLNNDKEKTNDIESSSTELENLRKEIFEKCMAPYSPDVKKKLEKGGKIKKKLKMKRKGASEILTSEKSSSTQEKKMKESKEKKESSNANKTKSSKSKFFTEDYIPLDASGPTKFAVSRVDEVKPYHEHDAKNFKQRMLYGNRIKRFNDSKRLEIDKMKQKVSKKFSS